MGRVEVKHLTLQVRSPQKVFALTSSMKNQMTIDPKRGEVFGGESSRRFVYNWMDGLGVK